MKYFIKILFKDEKLIVKNLLRELKINETPFQIELSPHTFINTWKHLINPKNQ